MRKQMLAILIALITTVSIFPMTIFAENPIQREGTEIILDSSDHSYSKDIAGTAVLNTGDAVISDMSINGDLIISEGVGSGNVTLNNVTIKGNILIYGGGVVSVKSSNIKSIEIAKEASGVQLLVAAHTTVSILTVNTKATIMNMGDIESLIVKKSGVILKENNPKEIIVYGKNIQKPLTPSFEYSISPTKITHASVKRITLSQQTAAPGTTVTGTILGSNMDSSVSVKLFNIRNLEITDQCTINYSRKSNIIDYSIILPEELKTGSYQVEAYIGNSAAAKADAGKELMIINENLTAEEILAEEMELSFEYFWNESNTEEGSNGYGIVRDNTDKGDKDYGSIAATGFGLSAYVIGAEREYITFDEGYERALGTLKTFYYNIENNHGFFPHFLHLSDGRPYEGTEISIIDTGLFLSGAIAAGEYFGGEVKEYSELIYTRIDWEWYRIDSSNRFYMGYRNGQFDKQDWDVAAEQLILYILGAGSPTHPVNGDMFYDFDRWQAEYDGISYIRSWANSLFAYQFSHAFIDFRNTTDREGVDWFENSQKAVLGNRQYCINNNEQSKTYSAVSWGLSACFSLNGYRGAYGAAPNGMPNDDSLIDNIGENDGTIPPYGALASIVFAPEEVFETALYYKNEHPDLWGKYGFKESYNLDAETPYYCERFYGLNKGITLIQNANYFDGTIWKYFMQNEYIQDGMREVEVTKN